MYSAFWDININKTQWIDLHTYLFLIPAKAEYIMIHELTGSGESGILVIADKMPSSTHIHQFR